MDDRARSDEGRGRAPWLKSDKALEFRAPFPPLPRQPLAIPGFPHRRRGRREFRAGGDAPSEDTVEVRSKLA